MTTPGVYSNPEKEASGLNEEEKDAFEHGHDADLSIHNTRTSVDQDIEKDAGGQDDKSSKNPALAESDPNDVWWDGPDDPENPLNWPGSKKWSNIFVLSLTTLIT
jgi:hypothetical protein